MFLKKQLEIFKTNAKLSFWQFETGKMFNCHAIGKSCTLKPRNSASEKKKKRQFLQTEISLKKVERSRKVSSRTRETI